MTGETNIANNQWQATATAATNAGTSSIKVGDPIPTVVTTVPGTAGSQAPVAPSAAPPMPTTPAEDKKAEAFKVFNTQKEFDDVAAGIKHSARESTMDGYEAHGVERHQWPAKEIFAKNAAKGLTKDENYGIMKFGGGKLGEIVSGAVSGALNPDSADAQNHAGLYYDEIRKRKSDIVTIAKNTGFSVEEIKKIKNHIFCDEHDLGNGQIGRFDPDYMMAQSWQRLIDGKNIQKHDYTLLKHELFERSHEDNGMDHDQAHILATKKYNYKKEADEYYAKINKHKKE